MIGTTSNGPENTTLTERFVEVLHIPFSVGCLVLSIIFGPPGAILFVYVQTNNLDEAISKTIYLFSGVHPTLLQSVIGLAFLSIILYYFLYMIRYMRLKLVATEKLLLPILLEGEDTFHKVFGPVSRYGPPVLIDFLLIFLFVFQDFPNIPENFIYFCDTPITLAFLVVSFPVWFLIFGTFAWVYFSSIRGLYQLGQTSLKLKSFHEDKMLGVRPMGSLSLSLAFTYFAGLGILALLPIVMTPDSSSPFYIGLLFVLTMLGILFFFLPLNTIHKKMVDEKHREHKALGEQLTMAVNRQDISSRSKMGPSLEDITEILVNINRLLTIDVSKDEINSVPNWPFDTQILSKLSAIFFSVTTIIIANFILSYARSHGLL